ncbi:MAG: PIG-L family deacetylase [Planctomycetes bacterium]|nr:PIG-L family deacetylase [Planctomycetota bacterium]MCC7171906.1 PIG-L family deacetylase [Planctomycetota bacterium]
MRLAPVVALAVMFATSMVRAGDPAADLDERGIVALEQALLDAGTLGRVMNLAAHPDDEDSGMLALCRHGLGLRTSAVYANRGEGGQNEIGSELYRELGAIREVETLRADRRIGAHAYFLGLEDFGFSKSADESFTHWGGQEAVVERVVLVYRLVRPDVVFTNHDATTGHGQHRALAIAGLEAFHLAADPTAFPEQFERYGVEPWQPTLFLERTNGPGQREEQAADRASWIHVRVDERDPIRGTTFRAQAHAALKEHASQGRWVEPDRAERSFRVKARQHESLLPPAEDPFDPVALTRLRVFRALAEAGDTPPKDHPAQRLLEYGAVRRQWPSTRSTEELQAAIDAQERAFAAILDADRDGRLRHLAADIAEARARLAHARAIAAGTDVPRDMAEPDPFLFASPAYDVLDPLRRAPRCEPVVVDFAPRKRLLVETADTNKTRVEAVAIVTLAAPLADTVPVELVGQDGAHARHVVWSGVVNPGATRQLLAIAFDFDANSRSGRFVLRDARTRTPWPHVELQVHRVSVRCPAGLTIGVVQSYDDTLVNALADLGVAVVRLQSDDLAFRDLSRFDAIFVDIRGYFVREDLVTFNDRLLAYARDGGTLVVQYQKSFEWNPATNGGHAFAPYPLLLSNARIVDEHAPVEMLKSDHPVLSWPNRIGSADFDGFVHERGLYFPKPPFAPEYRALLRCADPGDPALDGGLLVASVGKGRFAYTSFGWYRQWKNGHEGSLRLLANLAAWGRMESR